MDQSRVTVPEVSRSLLLVATVLALSACGPEKTEPADSDATESGEYSVDRTSGETTASIEGPDGTTTMRSGANVPVRLPAGFTLYPEAQVISNTVIGRGEGEGALVTFTSDASPEEIAAHYRREAQAAQIDIEVDATINGGAMLVGRGKDGLSFSLNATPQGEGSQAQIMVGRNLDR